MLRYLSGLNTSKLILYCYLIWYLVTVWFYFDPSVSLWINAAGISLIIGLALLLSVGSLKTWRDNIWQTVRLFAMPFCVSSFSSLIKDERYFFIFPSDLNVLLASTSFCILFVGLVFIAKKVV